MESRAVNDRVLTVPNVLSAVRLVLSGVFLHALLVAHADAWAVGILLVSGATDWADGKVARLTNQSSRLGELLDPAVDRLYMVIVPIAFAMRALVPWWLVIALLVRDALLTATLPVLRSRGLSALPVIYCGKAGTFALMSAFPLILVGQWDVSWSRVVLACGWAFLLWGVALYLWAGLLYLAQVTMVVRRIPKAGAAVGTPLTGADTDG